MTKKVDKQQMKSLIISIPLLLFCYISFSQTKVSDTVAFKKDFEQLLKKYGIVSKGYSINVTSINQKGGQTAFVITNNYLGDTTQRHLEDKDLNRILSDIKKINAENPMFDSSKVEIYSLPIPES